MPPRTSRSPRPRRPAGPPAAFTVRDARAADLPALARMGARLTREHHALDPGRFFLPPEPIEEGYRWWLGKELVNPRAVILVAAGRGAPVGYVYGRIERRDWNTLRDRCAVGVDLWVEPRARRAGVGKRLVEALLEHFRGRGQPRVFIQVAAGNRSALGIFEEMGFRRTLVELARELEAPPAAPPTRRAPRRR